MANRSGIEWTEFVWNFLAGCSHDSTGCRFCYAERLAYRFSKPGHLHEGLVHPVTHGWNGTVRRIPKAFDQPMRWRRPRKIFVNSMSDSFHESVSNEDIAAMFGVMAVSTQHIFQVLTKRAERMAEWFAWHRDQVMKRGELGDPLRICVEAAERYVPGISKQPRTRIWPLPHVHLGVSAENQEQLNRRVIHLLNCPAAVHWLSVEPMLGPIDLLATPAGDILCRCDGCMSMTRGTRIDWVVSGGESGPRARPHHLLWQRALRDQCAANGVPYFLKQWGEWVPASQLTEPASNLLPRRFWDGSSWQPADQQALLGDQDNLVVRIGKKKAGRLLDGVEHMEWPDTSHLGEAA